MTKNLRQNFNYLRMKRAFKVGLSAAKKICFTYFSESTLKIMKNVFCFILKALFVLKIFKF